MPRRLLGCITEKETYTLTRDFFFFSLDRSKISTAILLYAEKALGCITEKETYTLTRDFFVRQVKDFEGYIIICREGFGLYNGKRSVKKVKKAENGHYFTVQSLPSPFHIEKTYASFLTTSLPL